MNNITTVQIQRLFAQTAAAEEYTDWISAEA